ncbi:hypothetical protein [Flavobacterium sp. UMI-01]|uniref:hypothetical protein n=1 Tax=Flavobacterium sp. UMI-01 TaxID=1441053 RepID=UPI001C7DC69F|nr:hypothetical protein [Flavobacterium sp. UMI-01]GIZ10518.1 hypothetical protein FUMI01_32420 [Flavobacterium sp. UMI-01]
MKVVKLFCNVVLIVVSCTLVIIAFFSSCKNTKNESVIAPATVDTPMQTKAKKCYQAIVDNRVTTN